MSCKKFFPFFFSLVLLIGISPATIADTEAELQKALAEIEQLKSRLNVYELAGIPDEADSLNAQAVNTEITTQSSGNKAFQELEKQHQASRLKVGELQAELTELRKRLGQDTESNQLINENEALKLEKRKLLRKLDELGVLVDLEDQTEIEFKDFSANFVIVALVCLVIGILIGMYLYDYNNRRKHGGFRL